MRSLNAYHLNGLRAAEAVLRTGSLQAAADELGVSASAVSQQLNRAERQLGRALLERTPKGFLPTDFGRLFGARLTVGFRELQGAVEMVRQENECTLVVSAAPAFAAKWLVPRLSRHFALYPGVLVRIDASTGLADLEDSDVDVAIRMGAGNWPELRCELLLAQQIFPVCTPRIAERLSTPADLAEATVITDLSSMISWADWFAAAKIPPVGFKQGASFTDPMLCLDSVIAGHGVMLGWQLLTADALADGRLVAPFGVRADSGLGYWLCTSKGRRETRKVRNFRSWITGEIAETAKAFA